MWLAVVVIVLTGYLLGNLNGSVMISMMQKDDVRNHGSGNGGLTNFVRNFGYGGIFMAVLAIFMHRGNIKRLLSGTERKQSFSRKEKKA